jgi:hypothetical protein
MAAVYCGISNSPKQLSLSRMMPWRAFTKNGYDFGSPGEFRCLRSSQIFGAGD